MQSGSARRTTMIAAAATLLIGADYPAPTPYPKEDRAAVARHLERARRIAGDDLASAFAFRCIVSPRYRYLVEGVQANARTEPTRLFDNLYSVGQNMVAAFALTTSDGIILIDALNNAVEARDILLPNMRRVGLDPAQIRYVVVTHGHGDHYGGAKYLQDTFGARVIASEIDWKLILTPQTSGPFAGLVPPRRDMTVADGETLTLGDTAVRFFVTPGHTPGTLSMLFPVKAAGRSHLAGLYGGTGGGATPDAIRAQIASLARWRTIAAKADVLITNHPAHLDAVVKEELLRYAAPGASNPFVLGRSRYQRYFSILDECSRAQLARLGAGE